MKNRVRTTFDVIIIGGGVAGISTALWCAELGLAALLLEESAELGGQLLWTHNEIKNYPGREVQSGRELRDIFLAQLANRDFELSLQNRITGFDLREKSVTLADGANISARAMVIATGISRRKLNVEGEDEFKDRGILGSGQKSAETVAGKKVLVVGGGDAAFENSLILAETAEKVTLAHRRKSFRARAEFIERVKAHPKIEILTETAVHKISGTTHIESVEVKNTLTGISKVLPIDSILVRIGVEPNTKIFRGELKTDENGYLEVDRNGETSLPGIFAAGDVANPLALTISSAAGTGATVAKTIFFRRNA